MPKRLGAEKIATGHYARIGVRKNGEAFLMRGADIRKDQSYFLFSICSERLSGGIIPGRLAHKGRSSRYGAAHGLAERGSGRKARMRVSPQRGQPTRRSCGDGSMKA